MSEAPSWRGGHHQGCPRRRARYCAWDLAAPTWLPFLAHHLLKLCSSDPVSLETPQDPEEVAVPHRLDDVGVRPQLLALPDVPLVVRTRQHDDRQVSKGRLSPDPPEHLKTVHRGEGNVQE